MTAFKEFGDLDALSKRIGELQDIVVPHRAASRLFDLQTVFVLDSFRSHLSDLVSAEYVKNNVEPTHTGVTYALEVTGPNAQGFISLDCGRWDDRDSWKGYLNTTDDEGSAYPIDEVWSFFNTELTKDRTNAASPRTMTREAQAAAEDFVVLLYALGWVPAYEVPAP